MQIEGEVFGSSASPIPDMQVIGSDHLTLASDANDWYEALSEPLNSVDLRTLSERNFTFLKEKRSLEGLFELGELQ